MALIKCPECGNDVSEKAGVCPQCGNPIAKQKKDIKKLPMNIIVAIVGSVLIALAPFLSYVSVTLNLPGDVTVNKYNMWKILTPEAGGLKSGESAGFFGFIPTILVVIGIVSLILIGLQIVKGIDIKIFVKAIIPGIVIVLLLIFEVAGLSTFRETNEQFAEIFNQYSLGDLMYVKKGIGFYLLVVGVLAGIVSPFIKKKD